MAENLSKRYRIGLKEELHNTFGEAIASWIKSPISNLRSLRRLSRFDDNGDAEDVIWALKDVSFEVKPGEDVGLAASMTREEKQTFIRQQALVRNNIDWTDHAIRKGFHDGFQQEEVELGLRSAEVI